MATYQVDLQFKSKTQAIDDAANKLNSVQNTIKALSGNDPFSALAQGAQGLANASKAAKQQLSDQTSAIRAQQIAQRDLIKELANLKQKQIELAAAAKARANGGAYTKDEIQGLKNVSAQIDQTNSKYQAGKKTIIAYRQEVERLNKAQAGGGGGGGIGAIGGIGGKLTGLAEQFAPALSGISAMAGTAALAAAGVGALAAGVVAAVKPMVDFTNEVQRNREQLNLFTKDAAVTEGIISSLQRTADATSLGLPGLLAATKTMTAYGIEAQNAGAATKMLGDLALGDNEKLQRFSVNLAQISSLGKAYTVDLKQFGMAGIPIFAALSKTMGKSTAEIMKMAEEGKITYPIVIKALQSLTAEGESFYNGAEKGGTDLDRALNQLTGAWEKLSIVVGNAVTPMVVATFKTMADVLNAIVNAVKDAANEMQWFNLGVKDLFKNIDLFKQFVAGINAIGKSLSENKAIAFLMNPGAAILPPGLKELVYLALKLQDGKDNNPKTKVDTNAANELERRKLAESAIAQSRAQAIDEHAKLEKTLAKDRAALDKQTGRSLADAARGYAEQLADFKINQVEKIRALERSIMDERRTAEFKLAQDRQKLLDTQKQNEYNDQIRAARARGEDTGGLDLAKKLADVSSKSNADRKQAAFDQREKELTLQRRIADFKTETQKQIGEMQKGYARQVEGIYRTAAQTLNDKLIAAALESKRILESVKIPMPDGATDGATGGGGNMTAAQLTAATGAFKSLSTIIGNAESYGGDYTAFNRGGSNNGHTAHGSGKDPNLTNMTIAEIQRRQLAPGIPKNQELHAVGKYQIIGDTLKALLKGNYGQTGVKASDKFTPENQEKLGGALARNRLVPNNPEASMRGLRQEWIGLQNVPNSKLLPAIKEMLKGGNDEAKKIVAELKPKAAPSSFLSNFPVKNKNPLDISNFDSSILPKAKPVVAKPAIPALPTQITAPGEAALGRLQGVGAPANGIRPSTLGGGGLPAAGAGMAGVTAQNQKLTDATKEAAITAEKQKQKEIEEQIKTIVSETNLSRETDLAGQKLKNELDIATLDLMKSGVTPELAAQLALNQQQNALSNERLNKAKLEIEDSLKNKDLVGQARAEQELKLKLINDQIAANPALLAGLDAEAQKTKAIGEARSAFTDSQKLKNHMDGMRKELNDTQGQVIQLSGAIESELGSAMSNAATSMIEGTGKAQDAFAAMFKNIGKAFLDMAMKMIAKALVLKALGIIFPGAGGMGAAVGGGVNPGNGGAGFSGAFANYGGQTSFAGGGFTGDGPRAGGVDGQGGFNAVLHPQETVIDHSMMNGAMQRFQPSRSSGATATAADSATEESTNTVDVNYNVTEINSMRFVSEDQFQTGLAMAAKQGAQSGHAKVMNDLTNKRSARARIGL